MEFQKNIFSIYAIFIRIKKIFYKWRLDWLEKSIYQTLQKYFTIVLVELRTKGEFKL